MLHAVTDASFHDDVRERTDPIVVMFTGSWCQPCQKLYPIIEDLSRDFLGECAFFTADIENNEKIASELNLRSVPSLVLFSEGMVQDILTGTQPKHEIRLWINENI